MSLSRLEEQTARSTPGMVQASSRSLFGSIAAPNQVPPELRITPAHQLHTRVQADSLHSDADVDLEAAHPVPVSPSDSDISTVYERDHSAIQVPPQAHQPASRPSRTANLIPLAITSPQSSLDTDYAVSPETRHHHYDPRNNHSTHSLRPLLLRSSTGHRERTYALVRKRGGEQAGSMWVSCMPWSFREPSSALAGSRAGSRAHSGRQPTVRSKALHSMLCGLLLAAILSLYLGISVSNGGKVSSGVQITLLVVAILAGILFGYVLIDMFIFCRNMRQINHHQRLRSTVSFQPAATVIGPSSGRRRHKRRVRHRPGHGHGQENTDPNSAAPHHNHSHGHTHRRGRRRRRGPQACPDHQIPLSPGDALPNDDSIYSPTTPIRVHLLADDEAILTEHEKYFLQREDALADADADDEARAVTAAGTGLDGASGDTGPARPTLDRAASTIPVTAVNAGPTSPISPTRPMSLGLPARSSQSVPTTAGEAPAAPEDAESRASVNTTGRSVATGGAASESARKGGMIQIAPPPAYGLWRCSVRADPNLLHWRCVSDLPNSPATPRSPISPISPVSSASVASAASVASSTGPGRPTGAGAGVGAADAADAAAALLRSETLTGAMRAGEADEEGEGEQDPPPYSFVSAASSVSAISEDAHSNLPGPAV